MTISSSFSRLLPLLDDFFGCEDLEFSTKNIFRYSHNSAGDSSRHSNPSSEVDDVGFYLDSNSPSENKILSREKMNESVSEARWVPYFGDPKGEGFLLVLSHCLTRS